MTPLAFKDQGTGAVHRLVVDSTNPAILYASAVNGGIWKTGSALAPIGTPAVMPQWSTTTDGLPSLTIGAMAVDPANSQHVVAGGGARSNGLPPSAEGMVYVTTNGGTSWTTTGSAAMSGRRIRGIAVRGQTIVAAAESTDGKHPQGYVFRSADNGAHWTSLAGQGGLPATFGSAYDVVADPSADRFYLVFTDRGYGASGLYLGTNAGQSWTLISNKDTSAWGLPVTLSAWFTDGCGFFGGTDNARLAVGPTGALYAIVSAMGRPVYIGYTLDQGATWTQAEMPTRPVPVPPAPDPIPAPLTASPIVSITRGSVPGGQPTTILVEHNAGDVITPGALNSRSLRVRIVGVTGLADGDWIVGPYNDPATGTLSTTKFILLSKYTGADGDGTTTAVTATGTATWQCWQSTNEGGQAGTNLALAIDPTNPHLLYVGGDAAALHLVRGDTTNAASTTIPSPQWTTLVNEGAVDGRDVHADIRDMILDPTGQYLFMSCDGGVFLRTSPHDATGQWYSLAGQGATALITAEFRSIALDSVSHGIIGGTQDNGTPSELQGTVGTAIPWTQIEFADGVGVAAVSAQTSPATSYRYTSFQGSNDFELHTFDGTGNKISTVFLIDPDVTHTSKLLVNDGGVLKPLNQVENFDWAPTFGVNRQYDPAAAPQPNPQKWLLIPGHWNGVYESRDLGEHAALISGSPTNATSFSWGNASNVEALWVTAENGSNCGGPGQTTVFNRFAQGAPLVAEATWPSSGNSAATVVMSASNPNLAYVGVDSHVYQVTHGGGSPVELTGDLSYLSNGLYTGPGRIRSIVYAPSASNGDRIVIAAADGGVPGVFMMAIANPGVWTRLGTNLPNTNPWALDYDPLQDMLVVGTAGRGAWSLTGVTTLNRAPNAICKDVTQSADATCRASSSASAFNNGWSDPDGNPLTVTAVDPITLAPVAIGPDSPGSYPVTINVADNQGASALCKQQFIVRDTTPPQLILPADKTVNSCAASLLLSIGQATATDNCAGSPIPTGLVIQKNGVPLGTPIPVVGGQVTLAPGTYTVQWTVSDGANPPVQKNQTVTVGAGIEASQSFLMDDRTQLKTPGGGFAALLNAGTGTTRVAQDCKLGGIISKSAVTVQHRSTVNGDVVSGGKIFPDSDATITGSKTENAVVSLPALPTLPTFPNPTLGGFTVNSGVTMSKAPGSYSSATVLNGGTLNLQGGDYYFQSLTINSSSTIHVTATTRIFVHDSLIFNAPFVSTSGVVLPIFLGFAGTSLNMYAVFNGTLVAPNAAVIFGTGSGLTFTGSFFGRAFEVTPGSALVCSP
jgi:hypothetical protein